MVYKWIQYAVAGAGFILAWAEKNVRWGRKKSGGAESRPPKNNSASPAEFNSAPRAEQARGGAESERGETSNNRE